MKTIYNFFILLLLFSNHLHGQSATISGIVTDTEGHAVENVSIAYKNFGTTTSKDGSYHLTINTEGEILLAFSHISFVGFSKIFNLKIGDTLLFSPELISHTEELSEVEIADFYNTTIGSIHINTSEIKTIPGVNPGVENILMTLPSVNNNNELSTQYNVRGGNFDENLIYVNGIEVYKPFLVRSGQQEGLSFVNSAMVENIDFSAGGFQSKYGDKLSSVLDISYRKPTEFATSTDLSLIGGSVTIEGNLLNDKLSIIVGGRYRDNSLFVNSKDIESNYDPKFADIQTYLSYDINSRLNISFLGNYSKNEYNFSPISRKTKFGTISNPQELSVYYDGQEIDFYETVFGSINSTYQVNDNFQLGLSLSSYHTKESENYDIMAAYSLGETESDLSSENFGEVKFSEGIGSQLNHGRNKLDALINNIALKGVLVKERNTFEFGIKYQNEDIRDRLIEWEIIDSTGFSIRPPNQTTNNQPYEAFEGAIVPYQNIRAFNDIQINRISGYTQWGKKSFWGDHTAWYNAGIRAQNWSVKGKTISETSNQTTINPRGQIAIKPDWDKDLLFRLSSGLYYQPPFYKEFRDSTGTVQPKVKAQKSVHFVLGSEYSFKLWKRPFKLMTEAYYKYLWNVNPYTINNVRIRYAAKNNAKAYATGLDIRLNGEFVQGTESWISVGILSTKENIDDKGYIPRPTDQRFKAAILFQDYIPSIPELKMYLNLVYNSSLPGGSPSYADPYQYQSRLNAYKRADIGLSYALIKTTDSFNSDFTNAFKELSIGIEIFNMFDVQNSITNTWIRDVHSKTLYGIPNYMSGRVFNLKISMQF